MKRQYVFYNERKTKIDTRIIKFLNKNLTLDLELLYVFLIFLNS